MTQIATVERILDDSPCGDFRTPEVRLRPRLRGVRGLRRQRRIRLREGAEHRRRKTG